MNTKILLILLVRLYMAESSYSQDVQSFFQTFQGSGWSHCIDKANDKMYYFKGDKKYAIGIIDIYTQTCHYDLVHTFSITLNAQMRSGNPEEIWKTAGDLINKAIGIVGMQSYRNLYRGCTDDPGRLKSGDKYMFNAITSTSPNVNTAGAFGCDETLFILNNVRGAETGVSTYSSRDADVLMKSTMLFTVARDPITDAHRIQIVKRQLGIARSLQRIIYINGFTDCGTVKPVADTSKPCAMCVHCSANAADNVGFFYRIVFIIENLLDKIIRVMELVNDHKFIRVMELVNDIVDKIIDYFR